MRKKMRKLSELINSQIAAMQNFFRQIEHDPPCDFQSRGIVIQRLKHTVLYNYRADEGNKEQWLNILVEILDEEADIEMMKKSCHRLYFDGERPSNEESDEIAKTILEAYKNEKTVIKKSLITEKK